MSDDNMFFKHDDAYLDDAVLLNPGTNTTLVAVLAGVIGLVSGSFIWNVYSDGLRAKSGDLPLITAELDAYKIPPLTPAETGIPDTELRVLNPELAERDRAAFTGQAVTMDLEPVIEAQVPPISGMGGPPIAISQTPQTLSENTATRSGQRPIATQTNTRGRGVPLNLPTITPTATLQDTSPENALEDIVLDSTIESPPRLGRDLSPQFVQNGDFLVQLAAVRNEKAAEALWAKTMDANPELFYGANRHIQRADLDAKGIWYRLKVDGFTSREPAKLYCETLKANGVDCIVTQR